LGNKKEKVIKIIGYTIFWIIEIIVLFVSYIIFSISKTAKPTPPSFKIFIYLMAVSLIIVFISGSIIFVNMIIQVLITYFVNDEPIFKKSIKIENFIEKFWLICENIGIYSTISLIVFTFLFFLSELVYYIISIF
jgi:hypothetical protein